MQWNALIQTIPSIPAEIITRANAGTAVLIPRIGMTTNETELSLKLRGRQFPVRPAFAMTINKSQGQTLDHVGIYLPTKVFSHSQLYVALSRATTRCNVVLLSSDNVDSTEVNVVHKEILQ